MPHLRAALGFGLIGVLIACQQVQDIPVIGDMQTAALGDGCGAAARQDLVGENVAVLNTADLPEGRRILFPGMVATQDFQPGRLNIEVNSSDTITRVYCG